MTKKINTVKWMFGFTTKEAKKYIEENPEATDECLKAFLGNAKKTWRND